MSHGFPLVLGIIPVIIWIGVAVYLLVLFSRLVKAVERIADKFQT